MRTAPHSDVVAYRKLILLVEDEALIALTESISLKEAGYMVEIAATGEAAVERVDRAPVPDLILMDVDLGRGMDGTEAATAILAKRALPIVFLSSHSSAEILRRVRGITRYGYVPKHSSNFILLSAIETAFELFQRERDIEERDLMLRRAEEVAGLGYWYVAPGAREIRFSPGARAILGLSEESCSFEAYAGQVLSEDRAGRERAFRRLVEEGEPYDITYRVRRRDRGTVSVMRSSGRAYDGMSMGVLQDLTDISRLLGELHEFERRQAVTLRSIGDGVISTDREGRVVELNRMAEELTGWSLAEARGRSIAEVFSIVNAKTREAVENPILKVLETGYVVGLANHTILVSREGSERHIADSAAPIRDEGDALIGVVLVFRDVTGEYLGQEQLRREAVLFKAVFADSHIPMLLIDPARGAIRDANGAAKRFYGWSLEELRGMSVSRINTLSPERISAEMRRAMKEGGDDFRFVHRLADESERPVLVTSGPLRLDGETLLLSIVRDATESCEREREMRALKERNEAILGDARHRMKNNVQMIASLVGLQRAEEGEGRSVGFLAELQNRIAGLALVYEHLYLQDELELVGSREYLSSLLRSMESCSFPSGVGLREEIADMILPARFAVSLGLIAGELVMNACKYAFPAGRTGEITVSLSPATGGKLELRVRDDGAGMGGGRPMDGDSGSGLDIASSLVEQEGGGLRIEEAATGVSILCSFPASTILPPA
jgi:PAS domain S-box-containing protein